MTSEIIEQKPWILNMRSEFIEITPQMATEWMKFNVGNRNLPSANAKYYQRMIETGEFETTHQGIAFTGSKEKPERLIDGQTRLTAIIRSGLPLIQLVWFGCHEKSFEKIDGGKPRSFIDHHGWTKDKVSFCNAVMRIASPSNIKMTKNDADLIWSVFGDDFTNLMSNCPTNKKSITPAAVRVGACFAMRQNPEKADAISDQYRHMVLGSVENMMPSVGRLMVKLMGIQGGGGGAQFLQFSLSHKAMTPSNWSLTKLYPPDDEYRKNISQYIQVATGISFVKC